MKHPRWPATSPMTAVQTPIMAMEITKHGYPAPNPKQVWIEKFGKMQKILLFYLLVFDLLIFSWNNKKMISACLDYEFYFMQK